MSPCGGRLAPTLITGFLLLTTVLLSVEATLDYGDYPEGYFPFEEAPSKVPPKVRKPPYFQSHDLCPGVLEEASEVEQSLNNLCGDLNKGTLPQNPMNQAVMGHSYPFGLLKNLTLDFFSKALPILKQDKTLPRVAKLSSQNVLLRDQYRDDLGLPKKPKLASFSPPRRRPVRAALQQATVVDTTAVHALAPAIEVATDKTSLEDVLEETGRAAGSYREARAFCENNWGLFCLLYNAVSGKKVSSDPGDVVASERRDHDGGSEDTINSLGTGAMQPLTPCPSAVEYVTPVFARNYQSVWRYVVQIPYEGYFTQTVEVTQCLSNKCHYLSGACLASPRWVSLLVAEIYYPDAHFPVTASIPDLSRPAVGADTPPTRGDAQFLQRRQGQNSHLKSTLRPETALHHCDGTDEIGCFQVRLYYDWFLIPGSCKCWKQDYFAQFAYKK